MNNEKKFLFTFTEKKKYHPAIRTVEVYAADEMTAREIFALRFDSFTLNKDLHMHIPSGRNVTINKIEEVRK